MHMRSCGAYAGPHCVPCHEVQHTPQAMGDCDGPSWRTYARANSAHQTSVLAVPLHSVVASPVFIMKAYPSSTRPIKMKGNQIAASASRLGLSKIVTRMRIAHIVACHRLRLYWISTGSPRNPNRRSQAPAWVTRSRTPGRQAPRECRARRSRS